ncbi:TPA: hypothetical protein ACNH93_001814 [Citrobacter koseri]
MKINSEVSDKNEQKNSYQRKLMVVKGLEKEMLWLKKDQRACHFFLFHLITEFSEWAKLSVVTKCKNGPFLSESSRCTESLALHSDDPMHQVDTTGFPPCPELPVELERQIDEGSGIGVVSGNITCSDNIKEVNDNSFDAKKVADGKSDGKFTPVGLMSANGIVNSRVNNSSNIRNCFFSVIDQLQLRYHSNKQILDLISKVTFLWGTHFKRFPSPFSWLNSNNKEHCQWLWDEMHKRCVGIPFQPRDHIQQWHFVIATFDNWQGWTLEQQEYLTAKNPKRNPGKLFSGGLEQSRKEIEHKMILLDELKKAWDQRERRARRAKEPVAVKLTKSAQKKLEFIAHIEKTTSKDILNDLIDRAFNDTKRKSHQS